MERRSLLASSGGTGAVVIGLAIPLGPERTSIVVSFDGPLDPTTAQVPGYYHVNAVGTGNPEIVTSTGAADPVVSAVYNSGTQQVTLGLAGPLALNQFYRVMITSQPSIGVMDVLSTTTGGVTTTSDQPIDGDNDQTPAGDFYGLVGLGTSFRFTDNSGDTASIKLSKGGDVQLWRELNGDIDALGVVGTSGKSVLSGSVRRAKGSSGQVVLALTSGLSGVVNKLSPSSFPIQGSTTSSPAPVVATTKNLPYSLEIQPVAIPSVPTIQSAVSAQSGGLWLVFGGRTNGLHGFDPSGVVSFPPQYQNNNIYVIDPSTGQTWTEAWTSTGLPQSAWAPLASSNQESYQQGDRLYTIGGYSSVTTGPSSDPTTNFSTYDTLSSISVSGLIHAVLTQGAAVSSIEQISDPRFEVTGGELGMIGGRSYLVFGQDFQGGYNGVTGTSNGSQVYTDEIRSFQIIDNDQGSLAISNYQAQRDPVNFRRRDGNLVPVVFPDGKPGLEYLGGVFTVPAGGGYVNPVIIANNGTATVNSYQQYFSQYTSPRVGLYDSRTRSLDTILFGGISLYDYNFATGSLTSDTNLPFVDDVTTLVQRANGTSQEFIMPSQLPGLYGAGASYLAAPGLPTTANGVINLANLKGPTTLGYIYGGILSSSPNTFQNQPTTASGQVFKVVLVPN